MVDVFTLSYEQGTQKPDPAMFTRTLAAPNDERLHLVLALCDA